MTTAVCLKCGEFKLGAFNRCPKCGYTPHDDEELTKHMLVTDHFLNHEQLKSVAARIKAGEPLHFDPATLNAARVSKAELDANTRRLEVGCLVVVAAILILLTVGFLPYVRRP